VTLGDYEEWGESLSKGNGQCHSLLLKALQLQRSFGLLNKFFPFGAFFMQSLQFVIFIFVISLFTSSSHLFLGLPSDLVSAGDHSYTFLPCYFLAYGVYVQTKLFSAQGHSFGVELEICFERS
jgi:hypothetical protein